MGISENRASPASLFLVLKDLSRIESEMMPLWNQWLCLPRGQISSFFLFRGRDVAPQLIARSTISSKFSWYTVLPVNPRRRHQEVIRLLSALEWGILAGKIVHTSSSTIAPHTSTPTSNSWLNAVEGFFATLTRRRFAEWRLSLNPRS